MIFPSIALTLEIVHLFYSYYICDSYHIYKFKYAMLISFDHNC